MLFIPDSVKEFVEEYDWMERTETFPAFREMSPRFRAFYRYFTFYKDFLADVLKKGKV